MRAIPKDIELPIYWKTTLKEVEEALELVKKFDDPKSRAFTNGVLNNIKNILESSNE